MFGKVLPGLDKLRNWLRDPESIFRGIAQLHAIESLEAGSPRLLSGTNSGA